MCINFSRVSRVFFVSFALLCCAAVNASFAIQMSKSSTLRTLQTKFMKLYPARPSRKCCSATCFSDSSISSFSTLSPLQARKSSTGILPWKRSCFSLHCNRGDEVAVDAPTENTAEEMKTVNGWRSIDWDTYSTSTTTESTEVPTSSPLGTRYLHPHPSPVELVLVRDRRIYIKRDDLLALPGCNVSGNKARKFLSLYNVPSNDFPEAVVTHGGPQSNAMVALAALVHQKDLECRAAEEPSAKQTRSLNEQKLQEEEALTDKEQDKRIPGTSDRHKRFVYYTKKIPRWLRKTPSGNYLRALSLGMEVVELAPEEYKSIFFQEDDTNGPSATNDHPPASISPPVPNDSVWVPQGGASNVAAQGTTVLAREIFNFWKAENSGGSNPGEAKLAVVVPGGTGTTGYFLQRELNQLARKASAENVEMDIQVVVVPCVGDAEYLLRQMTRLHTSLHPIHDRNSKEHDNVQDTRRQSHMPLVLEPPPNPAQITTDKRFYYTFGKPHKSILATFDEMKEEHGVYLDLLYGAPTWSMLFRHWRKDSFHGNSGNVGNGGGSPIQGRQIMYLHTGGLEGISSQLTRYKHAGLVPPGMLQS